MVPRIVITGAPASGKTVFFRRLQKEPEMAGFLFFEELARKILTEKPLIRSDKSAFHRAIYEGQTAREAAAVDTPFITDRGTVDGFAFHPESAAEVGTTIEREYARYSAVIQLASAASLSKQYYVGDEIRNESVGTALEIEDALRKAWNGHPRYYFVEAQVDFEAKYIEFKRVVNRCMSDSKRD
jgi:predicted ATPase